MFMAAIFDNEMVMAIPQGYEPAHEGVGDGRLNPKVEKSIRWCAIPRKRRVGADVLYTDIWISMGYEAEAMIRKKAFGEFQINRRSWPGPGPCVCAARHAGQAGVGDHRRGDGR
jgi:ornithine carbamoyltransferase